MGKNHGRIVAINPNQISLLEIVPDGQDGYIERPRTLILHGET
jgi:type IV pilus assembly protein PilP